KNCANATKALYELVTFRGSVRDEFKSGTEILVFHRKPFEESDLLNDFHLLSRALVHKERTVWLLRLIGMEDNFGTFRILKSPAGYAKVLKIDQGFDGTKFESLECIVNTVADFASILGDFIEVSLNELLLLDKLDIGKSFCR